MPVKYGSMPFNNAVQFFRDKINLPTRSWTDTWEGMHSRAFVVAGAMKEDLLTDLRGAVGQVIENGDTLEQFRKNFDQIVQRHGWGYKGGRNWRTRVIYETNLYQAHNAGRYKQIQKVKQFRPYLRYRHNDAVEHPRPEHLAWDGLVLPVDDPWWDTHTPQNGWGCKCFVESLSERDLKRSGKTGPDKAPPIEWEQKTVGARGPNPRHVRVPKGIDPGFGYNPGKAAYGETLADDIMAEWNKQKDKAWIPLNPEGWAEAGRPSRVPLVPLPIDLGPRLTRQAQVVDALQDMIGGEEKLYRPGGVPVLLHTGVLGGHLKKDLARSEFLPLIDDLLTNPYEVWIGYEQHKGTGKVRLRTRIFKGYDIGRGKVLLFVANARHGYLEGLTFIPSSRFSQMNRRRKGWLLHADEE